MKHTTNEKFDLIVVGGGPGGSALSTFVAKAGHKVLLLERESHPRYQIGESLLPSTIHGICRLLGVWDEVQAAGFMRKRGGTFRWGKDPKPWTFAFGNSPALHQSDYAYQVERSKFDHLLINNARKHGVTVREQVNVVGLVSDGDRTTGVRYVGGDGREHTVEARFVADASGNQSRLHQSAGERVYSKFFQNVALFGYFENGKRLPPPNDGNILCAAFDQGWFWYIPLSPTLTSVGAVIARQHAEALKQDHETAMAELIDRCPLIKEYLGSATRVTEGVYGQLRIRKDYSYCNTKFWSPGLVLIGDAACFIDPVFSSGVHLATYSALLAARSINSCLEGVVHEKSAFAEFEQRYLREYRLFYDFLVAFYDMHNDPDSYYWSARKVLQTEEQANEAFIRLVGGGGSAAAEFFQDRQTMGKALEIVADAVSSGRTDVPERMPDAIAAAGRFDLANFGSKRFHETHQMMSQANAGEQRTPEKPLLPGGLVPSSDGLRWSEGASL